MNVLNEISGTCEKIPCPAANKLEAKLQLQLRTVYVGKTLGSSGQFTIRQISAMHSGPACGGFLKELKPFSFSSFIFLSAIFIVLIGTSTLILPTTLPCMLTIRALVLAQKDNKHK